MLGLLHARFALIAAFTFSGFFSAIAAFEAAHWQGQLALALTQLPSVIVALTPYPKAAGFAKTVLQVLNVFSFLAHRDSPGTLKAPLTQSAPPTVLGSAVTPVPKGLARIELVAGMALLTALACAHVTPLGQALIDCGTAALSSEATAAGPQVVAILSGGAPDWSAQLSTLLGNLGNGVICAVEALVAATQTKAALAPADQQVLARGQAWLDAQGVGTKIPVRVVGPAFKPSSP